jgi:hypothetical protein
MKSKKGLPFGNPSDYDLRKKSYLITAIFLTVVALADFTSKK